MNYFTLLMGAGLFKNRMDQVHPGSAKRAGREAASSRKLAGKIPASLTVTMIGSAENYPQHIDFVDTGHPALLRMWERRQRGYRAMGYRLATEAKTE